MSDEEHLEFEYAIQRHEKAITQDAKDIEQIKSQIALIAEALSCIEVAAYRGSLAAAHENALRRLGEITKKLSEDSHR